MKRTEVRTLLEQQAEENYKEFNHKLIPGVKNILGVRMGPLKDLAKSLAKEDYCAYFQELDQSKTETIYYEEIMLQGLIIGQIKMDSEERFALIEDFIPKIDNWAVCDSFCAGLKFTKKEPEKMWAFIQAYLADSREFPLRFGVVMLMDYFIDEEHIETNLSLLEGIHHQGYYVKMAVAWALSVCWVKFSQQTKAFFIKENNSLDDFTYNKAIQKIRESYRVSQEDKDFLKQLKRRNLWHSCRKQ
ncbi:DNA alkylation repair protein [Aminipila butyrica]|uniref:DNA alkylation repair protein n=1 Tax=Aminipila butyrica TaxID=433296 RepID=A0A858BQ40_9FIRM|nr:DNA alkylation repair protein [Aminipila butyrica]QIB67913.1 DNA alkylation repair protein [Aminipila butyrica]